MNNNFLNKVVDKLVGESIIDYKTKAVYLSDFPVPFNALNLIELPPPSLFADPFYDHCREVYGLTDPEIRKVWEEYKSIIVDKIKNKPYK